MDYISQYGKMYPTKGEYYMRFELFKKRLAEFEEWNNTPDVTSFMGITPFTDWTW